MNKQVTTLLIKGLPVKPEDLGQFVVDYIALRGLKEPTSKQVQGIMQLLSAGMFNLNDAINDSIKLNNLQVERIFDKEGKLIKTEVYDN